jgi:large subunit ribosomal protein L10
MPSQNVLKKNQAFVEDLANKLKNSVCGVLVDYKGIKVADDTKLRKTLRENGVTYFVVKNTLLKRALAVAGITGLDDLLEGTTAIGLAETDIVIAPKLLFEQQEASKGVYKIKGGFIEGNAVDNATIEEYAKLPSKEVLVAKLLFVLQSPMQRLAIAVNEIAKKQEEVA